ncbi:MAG: restriction endonuclease subunit S [Bacteroidales bacterium]|nr:restriction endonuclease subunit S [Bacteroidales bacterium]
MSTYPTYKLGEIITDAIGGDWGKDPSFQDDSYELAYCIRGAEYKNWASEKGSTAALRKIKSTNLLKRQLKEGDIIVEISGGGPEQPVGRTEVITKDVLDNFKGKKVLCTNFLRLIRPNISVVDSVFLNHYLKFFYSTGEIIKYQAGSNNLRNLKFNDYLTIPIPLPPLATQHQIVSRIESLFAELDKAVEHLRAAQQQLKTYRQAVLNHWLNNEDGKWETVKLGEVAEIKRGRSKHRPRNDKSLFGGKYPFIQTGEIREANGGTITTFSQTYSEKGLAQSRLWPKGTLCLTIAANIAETAYLGFDACFPDSVVGILAQEDKLSLDYFNLFIQLIKQEIENKASATAQKNINVDFLENLGVSLPPLSEQQRIVEEIESRLSQAEAAEAHIAESLQKTEALRQSILKKAFSGELV